MKLLERLRSNGHTAGLSIDDLANLIQNERRRAVIRLVADGERELRDLADRIAANEYDAPVELLTTRERKRVYISLYQTHLPTLADAEIIRQDHHTVTAGPNHAGALNAIEALEGYTVAPA